MSGWIQGTNNVTRTLSLDFVVIHRQIYSIATTSFKLVFPSDSTNFSNKELGLTGLVWV